MSRLVTITCTLALVLSTAFAAEAATKRTTVNANKDTALSGTKSEMCASAGDYSDSVVKKRDAGFPPSRLMSLIDERKDQASYSKEAIDFMRWVILSVYKYDAFDATRLRRMVEIECFERL